MNCHYITDEMEGIVNHIKIVLNMITRMHYDKNIDDNIMKEYCLRNKKYIEFILKCDEGKYNKQKQHIASIIHPYIQERV